jgi:hypothetical protein
MSPYVKKLLYTRDVSHYGLAIYIEKHCKAKERIMETQMFHHAKYYLQKIL